jgi:integrase/recombinase XerC
MQLSSPENHSGLIANYLQHVRVGKRLASKTVDLYSHELAKLQSLCEAQNLALTDVQHIHIRRWVASSHSGGKGAKTLALQLSSWRGFYKWLVGNGEMTHNPCLDIKPPKAAKPLPKALGVDAAMALAQYRAKIPTPLSAGADISPTAQGQLEVRDALIVELLYGCGLRVSELVGLDLAASADAMREGRGWIDEQAGEVHVFGKGSKRRMVPLGAKALDALLAYKPYRMALCKDDALEASLLLGSKGKRLTRHAVWSLLRSRSLAAGLDTPVHPHMLRHSFASHVLQSSGDLRAVQELLGHSSIASTQVYTRLDFQHLAKIYDNSHPRAKVKSTTPLPSPLPQGERGQNKESST